LDSPTHGYHIPNHARKNITELFCRALQTAPTNEEKARVSYEISSYVFRTFYLRKEASCFLQYALNNRSSYQFKACMLAYKTCTRDATLDQIKNLHKIAWNLATNNEQKAMWSYKTALAMFNNHPYSDQKNILEVLRYALMNKSSYQFKAHMSVFNIFIQRGEYRNALNWYYKMKQNYPQQTAKNGPYYDDLTNCYLEGSRPTTPRNYVDGLCFLNNHYNNVVMREKDTMLDELKNASFAFRGKLDPNF